MKLPVILLENFSGYFQGARIEIDGWTAFSRENDGHMERSQINTKIQGEKLSGTNRFGYELTSKRRYPTNQRKFPTNAQRAILAW